MVQLHSKSRVFLRAGDLSKTTVPRVEEKISADDSVQLSGVMTWSSSLAVSLAAVPESVVPVGVVRWPVRSFYGGNAERACAFFGGTACVFFGGSAESDCMFFGGSARGPVCSSVGVLRGPVCSLVGVPVSPLAEGSEPSLTLLVERLVWGLVELSGSRLTLNKWDSDLWHVIQNYGFHWLLNCIWGGGGGGGGGAPEQIVMVEGPPK